MKQLQKSTRLTDKGPCQTYIRKNKFVIDMNYKNYVNIRNYRVLLQFIY